VPAIVFVLSFTRWFERWAPLLLAAVGLAAGVGLITMQTMMPVEHSALLYPALVLATFYTYNFIGTRFIYALVVDVTVLIAYNAVFGLILDYPMYLMVNHDLIIISANLIGGFAGYWSEWQRRVLFLRDRELRQANAAKDRFFSIIAHDLRGPINSLALFYNDIVKGPADFTEEILALTRTTTNNISTLLEQLLVWARSQRGEIEFRPEALPLRTLLAEQLRLHAAQADTKGVALLLDEVPEARVFADRDMLQTILRNLVGNALKYTDRGGEVRLGAMRQTDGLEVRIEDSGTGINEATRATLFRLDQKPISQPGTRNEQGSGLGLILCREFVERNGGTIWVESDEGQGASFHFTLREATDAIEGGQLTPPPQRSLRILVADDQPLIRKTMAQLLRRLGHEVSFAADGKEAVEMAVTQRFDLILMDIDMPHLNGIEATRRLRAQGYDGRIAAWSSHMRSELEESDADITFDGYLDKHLSDDALDSALQRLTST
jgi:signal transduction histidine kinase